MDAIKSPTLKLRTRTLLTFENKAVKTGNGFTDTDPTSTTATTSSVLSGGIFMNPLKKA